jgi:hypothetical protein
MRPRDEACLRHAISQTPETFLHSGASSGLVRWPTEGVWNAETVGMWSWSAA